MKKSEPKTGKKSGIDRRSFVKLFPGAGAAGLTVSSLSLKALAADDDVFFKKAIDLLPFETSMGTATLPEILKRDPTIRYVAGRDEFRQVAAVATAQSKCVINAGYTYDADLLEKLPRLFPKRSK